MENVQQTGSGLVQRADDYSSAGCHLPERPHHRHGTETVQSCGWLVAKQNTRLGEQLEKVSALCVPRIKRITDQDGRE